MENMVSSEFWKGKRVLITGHSGFKGSWLSLWLNKLGAEVMGFSLQPEESSSIFYHAKIASVVESIFGDIRDYEIMKSNMLAFKPEIIFHLAAQPLVRDSYLDPLETYSTNVLGTANVLQAARSIDYCKAIVVVTSDKCYENEELNRPFQEQDPMGGHDPYSASKGCAELVTQSFRKSYFQESEVFLASARAGNVIGGGDWSKDRLIPDMVRAVQSGLKIELRNPKATRPWQHVLDPLSGYIKLAESLYKKTPDSDSAWNFGPPEMEDKEVAWITTNFLEMWGSESLWSIDEEKTHHEAQYLRLDSSKAIRQLNWKPVWNTTQALEHTFYWYQQSFLKDEMLNLSLEQIDLYSSEL